MTRADVLERIRCHNPLALPIGSAQRAAVLVPLRPRNADANSLEVVLTKRSQAMPTHSGQVSFPGGRMEATDASSPEAAALRESDEELGLPPAAVELLGRLDDTLTITGFHVTPVVGLIGSGQPLRPSPREVERVLAVPLEELMDAARWERREHFYAGARAFAWHFPHDSEDVWGATASMLRGLLGVLGVAQCG